MADVVDTRGSKEIILFLWLYISGFGFIFVFLYLLLDPMPESLAWLYFVYFCLSTSLLHAAFFLLNWSMKARGSRSRTKLPKYVEYFYTAVIATSLCQIFFAGPRLADYITARSGGEERLLASIRSKAETHFKTSCVKTDPIRFTPAYCQEVFRIATAPDLKRHILDTVIKNVAFLDHVLGYNVVSGGFAAAATPINTPMKQDIYRLSALDIVAHTSHASTIGLFSWLAIMLLPIGLALRLVKTSLELFGRLDEKPPVESLRLAPESPLLAIHTPEADTKKGELSGTLTLVGLFALVCVELGSAA